MRASERYRTGNGSITRMIILLILILMAILYPDTLRGLISFTCHAIAWPFRMMWRFTVYLALFVWYLVASFFKWILVI
jgi:hypothetical protein